MCLYLIRNAYVLQRLIQLYTCTHNPPAEQVIKPREALDLRETLNNIRHSMLCLMTPVENNSKKHSCSIKWTLKLVNVINKQP